MKVRASLIFTLIIIVFSSIASANSYLLEKDNNENFQISSNQIIYVDDDASPGWYDAIHVKTLNEGIKNASAGDTIFVYNGTYWIDVFINKTVNLKGENKNTTIIDEKGKILGLHVTADNVNISNFTIKNTTVAHWECSAITIKGNRSRVFNNIITDNRRGMILLNVFGVIVEDNLFLDNHNIHPDYTSYNLELINSYDNIIRGNIFINKEKCVLADFKLTNSDNNQIINNNLSGSNKDGILLISSNKNKIEYNNIDIVSKGYFGIELTKSNLNKIHHNNFINCFIKATARKSWLNNWRGNYWERPRILPKIIFVSKGIIGFIPCFNIDFFPAKELNQI